MSKLNRIFNRFGKQQQTHTEEEINEPKSIENDHEKEEQKVQESSSSNNEEEVTMKEHCCPLKIAKRSLK